jgi:tripartite ATP-independent transporter DctP family solute receptor
MRTFRWVIALMVVGGFLSVGFAGLAAAQDVKKWRMAAILAPDDPMTMHAVDWSARIKAKTNGKIDITVFDSGKLGHERETTEQMQTGALEAGILTGAVLANFAPVQGLYNLPYVFVNLKQCLAFDKTPEAAKLNGLFEAQAKMKMIGFFPEGFRHIMNSKRPVNTPADLKGLKIRVMENKIHVASINAMGATATPISWNEVITSIQTKVIDGFENSIPTLAHVKAWDLLKNLALTSHFYDVGFVVVAKKAWDSLSPAEQKALVEAQAEALEKSLKIIEDHDKKGLEQMKANGVAITTPNLKPFVAAVKPVQDNFLKDFPDLKPIVDKAISLQ